MSIAAAMNWWVRSGGVETNGGGFDSTVSGAGTNYADQDSPQLSITDLATVGVSAIVTSVAAGFTAAMVGNVIRIASGTNFIAGYYVIITYGAANTVTLDRNCTTGAGVTGVAKVGGAHASLLNYFNGGSGLGSPVLTSPLAPGHVVNQQGAGTSDPTGTVVYDYSAGYATFPAGNTSTGVIKFVGYNGRPFLGCGVLLFYSSSYIKIDHFSFKVLGSSNALYGVMGECQSGSLSDSYIDGNGFDVVGVWTNGSVISNRFVNSGSIGGNTSYGAISSQDYCTTAICNFIKGWRSNGIVLTKTDGALILENIIRDCKMDGVAVTSVSDQIPYSIIRNTIYNCRDGIRINDANSFYIANILNNIFSNNTGYGLNANFGSAAVNDKISTRFINYNNFYSNTSGARNNLSASANDTALDPQFTNAGSDDFTVGANMKAIGFPGAFPLGGTSYTDMGALQRVEPSANADIIGSRRLVPI